MEPIPCELSPIPAAVRALVEILAAADHQIYLVGGCVRDLIQGRSVSDFDLATSAPTESLLSLFPNAIPIGLQHGTVMVPTPGGPVDVTHFRSGSRIEDDLAHRDFTVNAMAYDVRECLLFDPFEGRSDLSKGRLRAVGSAADRFAEDPLRALRGARLVSTLGLAADADVEKAMVGARSGLGGVAAERIRRELSSLLLGSDVGEALALLRRTGIEADLAPDAPADAVAVVPALPWNLELRLAGWLRGTRAAGLLRRRRFPKRLSERVDRMVQMHPIDADVDVGHDGDVRRLIKRAGEDLMSGMLALRNAELRHGDASRQPDASQARERLGELVQTIERVLAHGQLALQRLDLAVSGHDVMKQLGCPPGAQVGHALTYLTDRVVEDPSLNSPEALAAVLEEWASRRLA